MPKPSPKNGIEMLQNGEYGLSDDDQHTHLVYLTREHPRYSPTYSFI